MGAPFTITTITLMTITITSITITTIAITTIAITSITVMITITRGRLAVSTGALPAGVGAHGGKTQTNCHQ